MSFNEAPCKCCGCTSLCRTGIPIIRYSDGSYSPPSITRRIPGSDRTEVVWLHPQLNTAWGDLSCAWNLVSGSVFEQTWNSVPKGAGYLSALATLEIAPSELADMYVRAAVTRILQTQHEDLPLLWNSILQITDSNSGFPGDSLRGPFLFTGEFEPSFLSTWTEGTVLTKSTKGCDAHQIIVEVPVLSRDIKNEGRTNYSADPWTVDTLIGCAADGSSPLATLRLRVEHGKELAFTDAGYMSDEAVQSHIFSAHKDYNPNVNSTRKMVELLAYAELLGESGSIEQSFFIPVGATSAGGAEWRVFLADDSVNVMMLAGESVHVFAPYSPSRNARSAECIGVSFVAGKDRQMSVIHNPMSRASRSRIVERPIGNAGHTENVTVSLSPATPADMAPYCNPQNTQFQQNAVLGSVPLSYFPWRLQDRCEWWEKDARVSAGRAGSGFSELVVEIEYDNYLVDGFFSSTLKSWPHGVFALGATNKADKPIIDNSFWFGEDLNEDFSGDLYAGGPVFVTGTIARVEWSAAIRWFGDSVVLASGNGSRCGDQWARVELLGRFIRTISTDPGITQSFFYRQTIIVGEKFFSGEKVDVAKGMGWTIAPRGFVEPFSGAVTPAITVKDFTVQLT